MSMDAFLAEHYGTNKTASAPAEDLEKQASVELFLKLASEQNIDLKAMPDTQVQALYDSWVQKTAEFPPPKEEKHEPKDEEKEKHEKAEKEHEEKKAYAEKIAEADFLGRTMAHAYVQELRKIAADTATPGAAAATGGGTKVAEIPEAFKAHMKGKDGKTEHKIEVKHEHEHKHDHDHSHEHKAASAIDQLAVDVAKKLAADAGLDAELAGRKGAADLTLGLAPEAKSKVASAPNVDAAVNLRALELLEQAGYPVEWKS